METHAYVADAKTLDRHSPIPLYQQLSDILNDQIKHGQLQPGDHLPSEFELMRQYDISRYVVRQTLNNLQRQGLIITEHGRGSFVSYQRFEKPLDVLQSYHEGMRKSGLQVDVIILTKRMMIPPAEVARQLEIPEDGEVFYLERIARVEGAPVNLLISYIVAGSKSNEELMNFPGGSLYEFLKQDCATCLHHSRSYIEVVFAEEYESRMLNVARGSVLLQIIGVVYEKDGRAIEYSRVVYPGAMFRFRFDSYMSDQSEDPKRYMLT